MLADIGSDGNIDPEDIQKRITNRTRAIIPVHMAGLPCEMKAIWALARERGIHVIEDAAHAAGAYYEGRPIGSGPTEVAAASDAVAFSFYATKNLTTGEGGMITTHRPGLGRNNANALAARHQSRSLGPLQRPRRAGTTMCLRTDSSTTSATFRRPSASTSSTSSTSLSNGAPYTPACTIDAFAGMEEVEPPPDNPRCRHAWHLYILRLNLRRDSRSIAASSFASCSERGIGTSVHFIPIPLLRFFARLPAGARKCPRALGLYPRIVSLPLYPAMTEEQVHYVAQSVREIWRGRDE